MDCKKYVVLDTETCNGIMEDGKLNLNFSLVYDIGWAVVDKKGNVYKTRSFVVSEIFFGESVLMQSAYYAEKLPQYYDDIRTGKRQVAPLYTIRQTLLADMEEYNTNIMCAHNARFDYNALNITERWVTKSKYRYFLPESVEVWDTLKMSADTICKQKMYRKFCEDNGYMTAHKIPRPRQTAEVLYRYITLDNDFVESHTGLEDVLIEKEILRKCIAQHKKMRRKLFED